MGQLDDQLVLLLRLRHVLLPQDMPDLRRLGDGSGLAVLATVPSVFPADVARWQCRS